MFFSIETAFTGILLLPKMLGVLPFDQGNKRLSPIWGTYSLFIISIFTVEVAFILFDPPVLARNSSLRQLLFRCQMLGLYASIVIFNMCILAHRRKMCLVFQALEKLKAEMRGEPNFLLILGYFCWQSVAIVVTVAFDSYCNTPHDTRVTIALSYYYLMISVLSVGTTPFVAILQILVTKLEHLVISLKSRQRPCTARIYSYLLLYEKSVSLVTSLNEAFSLQLLLITFVSFFNLTTNMYFIADYIVNRMGESGSKMVPVHVGWITMFSSMIIFPVYYCERTTKLAKQFNITLYQLMLDDTTDVSKNPKLRLHIAMKREVVFSACGFFNIDYTLVHSMVAAATTYMVILIQFGQPAVTEGDYRNASVTDKLAVSSAANQN